MLNGTYPEELAAEDTAPFEKRSKRTLDYGVLFQQ